MQPRNQLIWASILALPVASGACVELDVPASSRRAEIRNGTADPSDPHVVALQPRQVVCGLPTTPFCTGTLISPRVVLTAAHCFNNFEAASLEIFVGNDVDGDGDVVYADDVLIHPGYDRATLANDIAVVRLPVALEILPAPLMLPGDALSVGQQVRLVGFGITGPEAPTSAGLKRTGAAEIASLSPTTFEITASPAMSCDGDSGGPVFATVDADEVIAGVTSSGDDACTTLGVNTLVAAYADELIVPYVDDAATRAGAADAGPPAPGAIDVCSETCTGDGDCPEGTTCRFMDGSAHCAYPGLPTGYFDGSCDFNGDCAGGTCIARERAGRPDCACYYTCASPTPDAGASDTDATTCGDDCDSGGDGCGCAIGRREPPAWPLLLLAVPFARRRRHRRAATEAPR